MTCFAITLLACAAAVAAPAPRLVVLDVATEEKGIKPTALAAIANLVTLEVGRYAKGPSGIAQLDVLSGREIRDALKLEGDRQSLGCDEASCAGEIAQAFGARYVAFLVVVRLGSNVTLNLSLFDSQEARVVGRAAAQAETIPALAPALPAAVRTLLTNVVNVDGIKAAAPITRAPRAEPDEHMGGSTMVFPPLADDEIALELLPLHSDDAAICGYDSAADRWHCGGGVATEVTIEREKTGGAATHGVARFTPHTRAGCLSGVDVELLSAEEAVVVDWRDAVFVVDGQAVPARPSSPLDRPMNAPAGAFAKETIVGATTRCVGGPSLAGKDHDAVSLTLGFTVGGVPARARFLRTRHLATVAERELLALLPVPELPPPPADLLAADAPGPTPWASIGGLSVASALGLAAGVFVGAAWMPASAGSGDRALVGSGYGSVCFACFGVPAVGVGLLMDRSTTSAWEQKKLEGDRWRADKKRVAAFLRAREP